MTASSQIEWPHRASGWQDFAVGARARTQGLTITEAHIAAFAGLTGDWHPAHVDAEYAKHTPFGARIAHGALTFSLSMGLVVQSQLYGAAALAILGINNVRLHAPVFIGDTITTHTTITGARPTSDGKRGVITVHYEVTKQDHANVATYELVLLAWSRSDPV
jgi:acyl dehydratase